MAAPRLIYLVQYQDEYNECVLAVFDNDLEGAQKLVEKMQKWDAANIEEEEEEGESWSSSGASGGEEEEGSISVRSTPTASSGSEEEEEEEDDDSDWEPEDLFDPGYPFWEEHDHYTITGVELGRFYGWQKDEEPAGESEPAE